MVNIGLGIDTGGTFTDGVIFDLDTKDIIRKTKVITTRHDLAGAVDSCLSNLFAANTERFALEDIRMLSLSTTLATNAIVEGQGAEVGAILLGFEPRDPLPTPHIISLEGGCSIKGTITREVDLKKAETEILALKSHVDAFAVSGYLSVRNPSQELEVQKLIHRLTGYPVVCGHQLTSELGFHERTVTAVLNARLIPLITDLIGSVKRIMKEKGIRAPLMVVKGDGSLISEEKARERPVETLLSGPAASIVGGMALSKLDRGLVIDMGGTTTDVAVFADGKTAVSPKGARVGGWLTRVKAADITTIGLGGDSFIRISTNGVLSIGPQRVFPLCWIACKHPYLLGELEEINEDKKYFPVNSQPTTILAHIRDPLHLDLTATEKEILELVRESPHSLYYLSKALEKDVDILPWQRLVKIGSLHRASLTPTDILHAAGDFSRWDLRAALLGVEIMARRYGKKADIFIKDALEEIYYMGALVIMEVLAAAQGGRFLPGEKGSRYFIDEMLRPGKKARAGFIEFSVQPKVPIVAVGAPAGAFFPPIGDKLQGRVVVPESAEVANAVGTVCGRIVERVLVMVKPGEFGGFYVYTPQGREGFLELEDALKYGLESGREYVLKQAAVSKARDVEVKVDQQDKYSLLQGQTQEDGVDRRLYIESLLDIRAVGRPWSAGDE